MSKERILVADDAQLILKIIEDKLSEAGYEIITAMDGKEAVEQALDNPPDLVILDVMMPIMTGWEVCRILRQNSLTNALPIILLTARDQEADRIAGLELGADDYIVKPFSPNELLARVKAILARTKRSRQANPLTGLPGNEAIEEIINRRMIGKIPTAVVYADLDNFKAFNDVYGFKHGDKAIKLTARILSTSLEWWEDEEGFLGHIGGDDFVAIMVPEKTNEFCTMVIERFELEVKYLYKKEDLEKGYVVTTNRRGEWEKYPIMSISLAIVDIHQRGLVDYLKLGEVAASLKKQAKAKKGSSFVR